MHRVRCVPMINLGERLIKHGIHRIDGEVWRSAAQA
jgi:hypothetical protein